MPNAAAYIYDTPTTQPQPRSCTQSMMLRVISGPESNHDDPSTSDRVRIFDRIRLYTDRLAFFHLQMTPICSNGLSVS